MKKKSARSFMRPIILSASLCTLAITATLVGCQKEGTLEPVADHAQSNGVAKGGGEERPTELEPGTVLFKLNEEQQKAQDQAASDLLWGQYHEQATTGRPGVCHVLWGSTSAPNSATMFTGNFCNGTAQVSVVYDWYTLENASFGDEVSYDSFIVQGQGVVPTPYAGSATLVSAGAPPGCTSIGIACDECPVLRHFKVGVTMSGADYSEANTVNEVTGSSSCIPAPVVLSNTCSLAFPNSHYTDNPARLYTFPGVGVVHLVPDCALLSCPFPHTTCPIAGSLDYQALFSGGPSGTSTTTFTQPWDLSLPSGSYSYTCTLTYSFGSSLPLTGTFTIN